MTLFDGWTAKHNLSSKSPFRSTILDSDQASKGRSTCNDMSGVRREIIANIVLEEEKLSSQVRRKLLTWFFYLNEGDESWMLSRSSFRRKWDEKSGEWGWKWEDQARALVGKIENRPKSNWLEPQWYWSIKNDEQLWESFAGMFTCNGLKNCFQAKCSFSSSINSCLFKLRSFFRALLWTLIGNMSPRRFPNSLERCFPLFLRHNFAWKEHEIYPEMLNFHTRKSASF